MPSEPPSAGRGRTVLAVLLLVVLAGAAVFGWLSWSGKLTPGRSPSQAVSPAPLAGSPVAPSTDPAAQTAYAQAQAAMVVGSVETRLALMEDRLARIDQQANAASGNAARAEALLVAFATRRALDKGAPLGFIEDQLKLRFAGAQPQAVRTITEFARHPVTVDELAGQLDAMAPELVAVQRGDSGLVWLKRELSNLFVVRRAAAPTVKGADRILRAKLMLASGKTSEAIDEVSRLPGADSATAWLANARRYGDAQQALDVIETTAMLEPSRLRDATGAAVAQPSPLAVPPQPVASQPAPAPVVQ
jgi:hypothetical protein